MMDHKWLWILQWSIAVFWLIVCGVVGAFVIGAAVSGCTVYCGESEPCVPDTVIIIDCDLIFGGPDDADTIDLWEGEWSHDS